VRLRFRRSDSDTPPCLCACCLEQEAATRQEVALLAAVLVGLLLAGIALALTSCGPVSKPTPPVPPVGISQSRAEQECKDLYLQELKRAADTGGLASCALALVAGRTGEQQRAILKASPEWAEAHKPPPPVEVVHADGRIFRTASGAAWRWKGVSAFKLLALYAAGQDIEPFLTAYKGYNVLRVWPYVQGSGWGARGWDAPSVAQTKAFLTYVGQRGWTVELTLLTDDSPAKLAWANAFVRDLAAAPRPANVLVEIGNEPETHKHIDTAALRSTLDASGFVYASGNYEVSAHAFGHYLVAHTSRDAEWPRRAHDCLDYFQGGGPNTPADPPHHVPCVLDEPAKPQDVPYSADDARAYFGAASLMASGGTWHCETCKYGDLPTPQERELAAAALEGLNAFPADAPLGPYSRPVESSLRTYAIGPYMVRVRPTTPSVAGWTRIGESSVLWRR
jgi:hypothetical protein